jgi:nicotinamide riboside kinase
MTYRIVLTGPESTGKSTLARALGVELRAPCVPEASRLLAEAMAPDPLSAATVEPIARLTMRMADEALAHAPEFAVFDTDLVSTVVYARHYYGVCPEWIVQEARTRRAERYLLCLPDLPWIADGVRDQPKTRESLLASFRATLAEIGADAVEIHGVGEARLSAARAAVPHPSA